MVLIAVPSMAQNTKGDRPINNKKQIREGNAKSVRKKEKATTKDIAGRRLRTKNKSSANSANVGIKQPKSTRRHPNSNTDRAAANKSPNNRVVLRKKPSPHDRAWEGDISGYKPRKLEPMSAKEAAKRNVYPQPVRATRQPPEHASPFEHQRNKTSTGKTVVKRVPKSEDRAWKGNMRGGPVGTPTATGKVSNIFSQENKYSRYTSRKQKGGQKAISNKDKVAKSARNGSPGIPTQWGRSIPSTPGHKLFIQRGKRNPYWGKFSKGEKAFKGDITGHELRMKNFRSSSPGLVGRDTLKYFGKRPKGDAVFKGQSRKGKVTPGQPRGENGWLGDLAGFRLRGKKPRPGERAGKMIFPWNLSSTKPKGNSDPLPGHNNRSRSNSGVVGKPIPDKGPGSGALRLAQGLKRLRGAPSKGFQDQGEGYSGNIKARRPAKLGGSVSGRINNNKPLIGKGLPGSSARAMRYSGNLKSKQGKTFEDQGEGYTGDIKARRKAKLGGSVTGKINNNKPLVGKGLSGNSARAMRYSGNLKSKQGKTFEDQGEGFTGTIKAKKKPRLGGSISGKFDHNDPVQGKTLPRGSIRAMRYSGTLKSKQGKTFEDQGEGYSGDIKARKKPKLGGSVSGTLTTNKPLQGKAIPRGSIRAMRYSGTLKNKQGKTFEDQGEGFSGDIKAKKPVKGGGSVARNNWNNDGKAVTQLNTSSSSIRASAFHGQIKAKKANLGGGGTVKRNDWNNEGKPTTQLNTSSSSVRASTYHGFQKGKKRITGGGGSISGKLWNNNEEPIMTRGADRSSNTNARGKMIMKREYTQNPNAVPESTKKQKPNKNISEIGGLQAKVKRPDLHKPEQGVKKLLTLVTPKSTPTKAAEYTKVIKDQEHKHNPSSAKGSLKVLYLGKAFARTEDYQGNVKMKKYNDKDLHPDAKFAHSGVNNVKEERTIMVNVKLMWAKLFHKSEQDSDDAKKKPQKLRYDKREKGMWAD